MKARNISVLPFLCLLQNLQLVVADVPAGCHAIMNLVFLLDSSESMIEYDTWCKPYYNWNLMRNLTKGIIQDLPVHPDQTRVAYVQYSKNSKLVFDLDTHTNVYDIHRAIDNEVFHLGDYTDTSQALRFIRQNVLNTNYERIHARDVLVVISDGLSNYDQMNTIPMADELIRLHNTEIFTIAASPYVDETELKGIASFPKNDHYLQISDSRKLDEYVSTMVTRLCTPPDNEPVFCDVVQTDLVFLVDNSGSITEKDKDLKNNYMLLLEFLKNFVNTMDIGPTTTRVGAVRFSYDSKIEFYLDQYSTKQDVVNAINRIGYDGSTTNTSGALWTAREKLFVPYRGDRPDVRNVIILITDGESNVDENRTIPEAVLTREAGVILFVVGVTSQINEDELKGIASSPVQNHFFKTISVESLDAIFNQLLHYVCTKEEDHNCDEDNSCDKPNSPDINISWDGRFSVDDCDPNGNSNTGKIDKNKKNGSTKYCMTISLYLLVYLITIIHSCR